MLTEDRKQIITEKVFEILHHNGLSREDINHFFKPDSPDEVKDDPRRFSNPHRNSRNWIELYHKRTAVERVNSRLKVNLGLEIFKVQGIEKVLVHMLLSNICLVSGTIAVNQKGCCKSVA